MIMIIVTIMMMTKMLTAQLCSGVFAWLSMQAGKFPAQYKRAQFLPLLKKAWLDSSSRANYRPISNLSTMSKIPEWLSFACLLPDLLASADFSQTFKSRLKTFLFCQTSSCLWLTSVCVKFEVVCDFFCCHLVVRFQEKSGIVAYTYNAQNPLKFIGWNYDV